MTSLYEKGGKRIFDLTASALCFAALVPIMAIVAAAIRGEDGGPFLFRQKRSGAHLQTFTVLKFRSLPLNTHELTSTAARDVHPTHVGRVIRRLNFDELPQLLNIMRGEMSIVGPRPALLTQRELLELRSRGGATDLKPGLTGLAQVSAYDGMTEVNKAAFDNQYRRKVTLREDLRIIISTFGYLSRRPPIY